MRCIWTCVMGATKRRGARLGVEGENGCRRSILSIISTLPNLQPQRRSCRGNLRLSYHRIHCHPTNKIRQSPLPSLPGSATPPPPSLDLAAIPRRSRTTSTAAVESRRPARTRIPLRAGQLREGISESRMIWSLRLLSACRSGEDLAVSSRRPPQPRRRIIMRCRPRRITLGSP